MLITFKSKNSGEVFMLDKHALVVLKVAGRDYGEQLPAEGVFTAEQLSDAIANLRQAVEEGHVEGMSDDEIIFYDALVDNGSAKEVMGDDQLRTIAKVLVEQVRNDATIDWKHRKKVQAKLRVNVKKTLAKYGYPPDQQAMATELVLEQAKSYGDVWSREKKRDSLGGASLVN